MPSSPRMGRGSLILSGLLMFKFVSLAQFIFGGVHVVYVSCDKVLLKSLNHKKINKSIFSCKIKIQKFIYQILKSKTILIQHYKVALIWFFFLLLMFLIIWVLLNNAVVLAYMRRKGYKVTYVVL